MSATHCPVCHAPKAKKWHLVCAECWAKVPAATQDEIFRLYRAERDSERHRVKCMEVVRELYRQRPNPPPSRRTRP